MPESRAPIELQGISLAELQRLIDERDRGAGILLISEDLDELLSLADRILVIYEGQIVGEVPPEDERIDEIGLMMAGTKLEGTRANKD